MNMNKRGQGLSTSAIILIVLGVFILAILIFGFTKGWAQFSVYTKSDNVNTIVQQCQTACTSSNVYDYCSRELNLVASDLPNGNKEVLGNCTYFATTSGYEKYGVVSCGAICS